MRDFMDAFEEEQILPVKREQVSLIVAARPYITACFIVTVLLSVWAGLRRLISRTASF